jgi:5-methylcytosine-specific restriction enzyme subunit McrC
LPLGGTDIFLPSFLVDMETLFEEYVLRVLSQRLRQFRVAGAGESAKPLFDDMVAPEANPDVVIYSDGTAVAVGDVKYKPRYTREDLNQVISYALSYNVKVAVLFLPALTEQDAGRTEIGRIRGIQVYEYALWLGSAELSLEAQRMADSIGGLLPVPVPS